MRTWALWNLILSIAGAILALVMGLRLLTRIREEDEDEEYHDERRRIRLPFIIAVPVLAIIAIILFILTQDMRLRMILIDWWTLAHLILFIAGLVCFIFAFRRRRDEDDDSGYYAEDGSFHKGDPYIETI